MKHVEHSIECRKCVLSCDTLLAGFGQVQGVFGVLGDEILYVYTQYTYIIRIYGILRI
jgi:hypothetical protein